MFSMRARMRRHQVTCPRHVDVMTKILFGWWCHSDNDPSMPGSRAAIRSALGPRSSLVLRYEPSIFGSRRAHELLDLHQYTGLRWLAGQHLGDEIDRRLDPRGAPELPDADRLIERAGRHFQLLVGDLRRPGVQVHDRGEDGQPRDECRVVLPNGLSGGSWRRRAKMDFSSSWATLPSTPDSAAEPTHTTACRSTSGSWKWSAWNTSWASGSHSTPSCGGIGAAGCQRVGSATMSLSVVSRSNADKPSR